MQYTALLSCTFFRGSIRFNVRNILQAGNKGYEFNCAFSNKVFRFSFDETALRNRCFHDFFNGTKGKDSKEIKCVAPYSSPCIFFIVEIYNMNIILKCIVDMQNTYYIDK